MDNDGAFESRQSIVRGVLAAIQDKDTEVIGIVGLGGIGKKTLANEVAELAIKERLIDDVVQVEYIPYRHVEKIIQDRIADSLGLALEEISLPVRAAQLSHRISVGGRRILIILKDLLIPVDLMEMGISLTSCCKILLTSRNTGVPHSMRASSVFLVGPLTALESWILFQRELNRKIHPDDQLYETAREICEQCRGLPLSITAYARVLANKMKVEWVDVKNKSIQPREKDEFNFPAVLFDPLKASYDSLETEETKCIFLLCCLFPLDSNIPIENLVRYTVGLRLFERDVTLQEARDVVYSCVRTAKNLNLLLGTEDKECVRMHGIVRDFGLTVASRDYSLVISLNLDEIDELPSRQNYPNLKLLQLVSQSSTPLLENPEKLFAGTSELEVIDLKGIFIRGSLYMLWNLRTMCLDYCTLPEDISFFGNLKKLEILSCAYSNISELLPNTIGCLNELKLLDLTWCTRLRKVSRGVLSSLVHLEELYMRGTSIKWAEEVYTNDYEGAETNASFDEIKSMSKLVAIEIDVPYEVLPIAGKKRGFFRKGRKVYI